MVWSSASWLPSAGRGAGPTGIDPAGSPLDGGFAEGEAAFDMPGGDAGDLLPTADRDAEIERVQLAHPCHAAGPLRGPGFRAASAPPGEDDPLAPAAARVHVAGG